MLKCHGSNVQKSFGKTFFFLPGILVDKDGRDDDDSAMLNFVATRAERE